eukprot:SAG31_NODE_27487_length_425_cov_0.941718_1_plen_44_part_01
MIFPIVDVYRINRWRRGASLAEGVGNYVASAQLIRTCFVAPFLF